MRTPSIIQRPFGPASTWLGSVLLLVAVVSAVATACGGGGDVGVAPTLTIALAGAGHGTVTGSPGSLSCDNANPSGSVSGTCTADLPDNSEVTLSATAESGSTFAGWSGNGVTCGTSNPCTFTVSESRTITATFDAGAATQVLTVVGGGTGTGQIVSDPDGIDCTISNGAEGDTGCSASFASGSSVQLQVQTGELQGWGGACSGSGPCSVVLSEDRTVIATFAPAAQATQLVFVGQPGAVQVGNAITPPVQVAFQDGSGQTATNRTDAITLRIGANPGGATLGGLVTHSAQNGVATFPDLTLDKSGDNYTLVAQATGLPDGTSSGFNVSDLPVAHLAFLVQPPLTAPAGAPISPAVKVEILDEQNAVLTARTDVINISLQSPPDGGPLSGSVSATAVAGVATFSNLTVQKAAKGYTLSASTQNASGATSRAFEIIAGPAQLISRISMANQEAPVGTNVSDRPSVLVVDAFNNPVEGFPVTWRVTQGGGKVQASQTDPVLRPTGPLGLSTAVSWTLGPDVATNNNELHAEADVNGSPIVFKASGTLPVGQGLFRGQLLEANNAGIDPQQIPIAGANLDFLEFGTTTVLKSTTSGSDGNWVSPPLPLNKEYRINITKPGKKDVQVEKPRLSDNATQFALGPRGMVVGSDEDGEAGLEVDVTLSGGAQDAPVTVEVYHGIYIGESDASLVMVTGNRDGPGAVIFSPNFPEEDPNPLHDWGTLTLRVIAEGYVTQTMDLYIGCPFCTRTISVTLTTP
jgi:hypothetical protein